MAAIASDTIEITINDIPVQAPKGELVVETVKRIGLEIPIFCYHPRMKPVGMCRMCLVEVGFKQADGSVRMMPKPQAGCTLPISEGMVVLTDSEMVHRDRKGVLEFLLINHPLDCPICDRGGECPLQNNTLFYGPSTSRFVELKRHLPKAFPLSKFVTLDLERCIQCGRCVRFTEEISGDSELAFRFRGASMQPSTFEMRDFSSKFSGNVIEICPVGALTNAKYRFRARPWDLETSPGICTVCSNGCNVWLDHRVGKLVRVNGRTNEVVNEEWTCDRGKFGHDFYNHPDRLTQPLIRRNDRLEPCSWPEAYAAVAHGFKAGGKNVALLAGSDLSNEDLFLLKKLFVEELKSPNLDHRYYNDLTDSHAAALKSIASYEEEPVIVVFGTPLADELPILYLRIRKAWFNNGAKVIVINDRTTDADSFAYAVLRHKPGAEAEAAAGLAAALAGKKKPADVAKETGMSEDQIKLAVEALKGSKAPVVTSRNIFNLAGSTEAVKELEALGKSLGGLNIYALHSNEQGALEIGITPQPGGLDTQGILKAAAGGKIEALWLAGDDPLLLSDRKQAQKALENVNFLIVQAHTRSECLDYASVVFPCTAPAEMDGTYTNCERRVQRLKGPLAPLGEAKPVWQACSELAARMRPQTPYFGVRDVIKHLALAVPSFKKAADLDDEGTIL